MNRKGRPPGTPNKTTQAVKDAIVAAFEEGGGKEWLMMLMNSEPQVFAMLLAKVLPKQVEAEISGPGGGPISVVTGVTEPKA